MCACIDFIPCCKYSLSHAEVTAKGSGSLTWALLTATNSRLFLKDLSAAADLRSHFTGFKWGDSGCVCWMLLYVGWWIAEHVLDASFSFVSGRPLTLSSTDSVQKLWDVSCTLEQFLAETNAAGQASICGSGLGQTLMWGHKQHELWQNFCFNLLWFFWSLGYLLKIHTAWNVTHPDCAGQAGLFSVHHNLMCPLAEMKLDSYVCVHAVW